MMRLVWTLVLALVSVGAIADVEKEKEPEIIVRGLVGPAFTAGLAGDSGLSVGLDLEAELTEKFSLGAIFNLGRFEARLPNPDSIVKSFAVNPRFVVRKGSARFSFGAIVGAQVVSTDVVVATGTSTGGITGSTSTTSLAVGANATVDIPIWGVWNLSFSPHFIYGTSSKVSQVGLMSGFGFRF